MEEANFINLFLKNFLLKNFNRMNALNFFFSDEFILLLKKKKRKNSNHFVY